MTDRTGETDSDDVVISDPPFRRAVDDGSAISVGGRSENNGAKEVVVSVARRVVSIEALLKQLVEDEAYANKNVVVTQTATAAIVEATSKLEKTIKRFDAAVSEIKETIGTRRNENLKPSFLHGVGCCGCLYGSVYVCVITTAVLLAFVVVVAMFSEPSSGI